MRTFATAIQSVHAGGTWVNRVADAFGEPDLGGKADQGAAPAAGTGGKRP